MIKPSPPCLDCHDRHPRCHSTCSRWQEYSEQNNRYLELYHAEKHRDDDYYHHVKNVSMKNRR